jgi:cold shock CspA family protein
MKKGIVDRLVRERGFGFIRSERGETVFFHRSALSTGEFDRLEQGDRVEFEDAMGDKGLKATSVRLVSRSGVTT